MKLFTSVVITLFASAALATGGTTAAPAPTAAKPAATEKAAPAKPAATEKAADHGHKMAKGCEGKMGAELTKCEAEMKKH